MGPTDMLDQLSFWVVYPAFLFVVTAAASAAYFARLRSRTRLRDLEVAEVAYQSFIDAYDRLNGDPALPDIAQQSLDALLDCAGDRRFAHDMVGILESHWEKTGTSIHQEDSRLMQEMAAIRGTRPDLYNAFGEAVVTAIMAAALRWPETAHAFRRTALRLAINQPREVAAVSGAANRLRRTYFPQDSGSGGGISPSGGGPMIPAM